MGFDAHRIGSSNAMRVCLLDSLQLLAGGVLPVCCR